MFDYDPASKRPLTSKLIFVGGSEWWINVEHPTFEFDVAELNVDQLAVAVFMQVQYVYFGAQWVGVTKCSKCEYR